MVRHTGGSGPRFLFIDPYLTHSHRAFMEGLLAHVPARWTALGLPGRRFRWRMRGAPAYLATAAREVLAQPWDVVVCTSMLGLAELRGLVPELAAAPAVAVFHENQLAYPDPGRADAAQQGRDLFLAWTNLTTALCARRVVFNSRYHQAQFLAAAQALLARLPDATPPGLAEAIEAKSLALPVPIDPAPAAGLKRQPRDGPLRIVWNHRWDHDKDPEALFAALGELAAQGLEFAAAVLGPRPPRWPECFDQAPALLGARLAHLGPVDDRREYWRWLLWADVAVSTARQEYYGLALAEAVWAGCRPLAPAALVYPELYPAEALYPPGGLAPALAALAADPVAARAQTCQHVMNDNTWPRQAPAWRALLEEAAS